MAQAWAVGDVHVGAAGLGDDGDHRVGAIADRERCRRAQLVRERTERTGRDLLEARTHGARELEQPESEQMAPAMPAHDEAFLGERAEEAVDARAVGQELIGEFADREPRGVVGE